MKLITNMKSPSKGLLINLAFFCISIFAINSFASNYSFQHMESQIKTIRIYKTGNELAEPLFYLGANESITLTFDDLADSPLSYSYTIIHCNSDWNESNVMKSDFMDGFETNPINDYQNSYSTTVPYTHYRLIIPNNDVRIKLSGNYIVRVFDTYNPEKIAFEKRFMVVEDLLSMTTKLRQALDTERSSTSQQIELTVLTSPLNISNPYNELKVVALQNGQYQNSVYGIQPVFIRSNEIVYSSPDNLIFDGVNEFRSFNINSIRFISNGIKSIDMVGGVYNALLLHAENNRMQKYSTLADINGKYKVNLEYSDQSDIEADYLWVYFTLPYYNQIQGKEVYVYGGLTDWQFSNSNQMYYNYQRSAYELRLQLKQGYYNYRFVVKDIKTGELDATFFEGNHFETENDYIILIYFKQASARYERLVGMKRLNSRIGI